MLGATSCTALKIPAPAPGKNFRYYSTAVGSVVGQLLFGYLWDKWSHANSLLLFTLILIVFAALGADAYGAHSSAERHVSGSYSLPFPSRGRYRKRTPRQIGQMLPSHWRTKSWNKKPLVRRFHKCHAGGNGENFPNCFFVSSVFAP